MANPSWPWLNLGPQDLPSYFVKEAEDSSWWALFNPERSRVLDVDLLYRLPHDSIVSCLRFSPNDKLLATGSNHFATLFDAKTGQTICSLFHETLTPRAPMYVRSVCFSPDSKLLYTGAEDGRIRIWDIPQRSLRRLMHAHSQEIFSIDLSRDGRWLVSGSEDGKARIWDLHSGTRSASRVLDATSAPPPSPSPRVYSIAAVAFSPDAQLVATAHVDTVVRLWNAATAQLVAQLFGHADAVYAVKFMPDGKRIATAGLDASLRLWDLTDLLASLASDSAQRGGATTASLGSNHTVPCVRTFKGHDDEVMCMNVSPDGHWIVSGSKDHKLIFWRSEPGNGSSAQCVLQGHSNIVLGVDFSSAGLFASCDIVHNAYIWSYQTMYK